MGLAICGIPVSTATVMPFLFDMTDSVDRWKNLSAKSIEVSVARDAESTQIASRIQSELFRDIGDFNGHKSILRRDSITCYPGAIARCFCRASLAVLSSIFILIYNHHRNSSLPVASVPAASTCIANCS